MVVYVLKKETNILGKRYDKEYETDFTQGLGWAVWSYLWWGGCVVSMIMSFVSDDWGFIIFLGVAFIYGFRNKYSIFDNKFQKKEAKILKKSSRNYRI